MNSAYLICLTHALNSLATNLGLSYLIFKRIKPDESDFEVVVPQPQPKSPSGAAGAVAIPELDEILLVRQLLAELCESYRNSNLTELEKKAVVSKAIHLFIKSLKKEEPNLKVRLLRATYNYNSFYLQRNLSLQFNHFVEITLDEFREMVSKESEHDT